MHIHTCIHTCTSFALLCMHISIQCTHTYLHVPPGIYMYTLSITYILLLLYYVIIIFMSYSKVFPGEANTCPSVDTSVYTHLIIP